MLLKLSTGMMVGFTALVLTCAAQQPPATPDSAAQGSADREKAGDTTVTGCLSQDAKDKDMYLITGEDGKTWNLKSTSVKLASHVSHKVTVSGKAAKEAGAGQPGDLTVSSLKMVSQTCQ